MDVQRGGGATPSFTLRTSSAVGARDGAPAWLIVSRTERLPHRLYDAPTEMALIFGAGPLCPCDGTNRIFSVILLVALGRALLGALGAANACSFGAFGERRRVLGRNRGRRRDHLFAKSGS